VLTERGAAFLPYAQRGLAMVGQGVEVAQLTEAGQRGRVRVGSMQSIADAYLDVIIPAFYRRHPPVELVVEIAHARQLTEWVEDGIVQLALVAWPFFHPALEPLMRLQESVVLVAAPHHPLASMPDLTLAEMARLANPFFLIRWDEGLLGTLVRQCAEQATSVIEAPSMVVRRLLISGMGAAFFMRALVAADLAAGRPVELRVPELPPLSRESAMLCLRWQVALPQATMEFIAILRTELERLGVRILPSG
jgi:DNA-binding transcriptional LysR family regulator